MRTLIDIFPLIEQGFPDEIDQHAIKLVLLAEEIDTLPTRHEFDLLRKDVEKSEHRVLLRCGGMIAVAAGVVVGLLKLL